jgi:hypothetical protein
MRVIDFLAVIDYVAIKNPIVHESIFAVIVGTAMSNGVFLF